jgi:hypothetical protein
MLPQIGVLWDLAGVARVPTKSGGEFRPKKEN